MARSAGDGLPISNYDAWIALAGSLFGGSGLKSLEYWFARNKRARDELRSEFRDEIGQLRDENNRLHSKVDDLEATVDDWRDKYYKILAELAHRGIVIEE